VTFHLSLYPDSTTDINELHLEQNMTAQREKRVTALLHARCRRVVNITFQLLYPQERDPVTTTTNINITNPNQ
jgi:hypothetical protein